MNNKKKGKIGENIAAAFVIDKGLRILHENFRTEIGELDIVATDERALIFIEVKYRKNESFGYPAEAVGQSKIKKISQVASQYINKHRLFDIDVRFDVIEIFADEKRINYIENAFDSYVRY